MLKWKRNSLSIQSLPSVGDLHPRVANWWLNTTWLITPPGRLNLHTFTYITHTLHYTWNKYLARFERNSGNWILDRIKGIFVAYFSARGLVTKSKIRLVYYSWNKGKYPQRHLITGLKRISYKKTECSDWCHKKIDILTTLTSITTPMGVFMNGRFVSDAIVFMLFYNSKI